MPDLILLDLNLPDGDGFQLCKEINLNNSIPIIILTAKSDIVDKVLGLELGADDYITKPFHIKEVISRIRAIFRRIEKTTNSSNSNFTNINENIKINFKNRTVLKNDDIIQLKPKEYELLEFFVQNRNKVFSREQLIDNVWEFSLNTLVLEIIKISKGLSSIKEDYIEFNIKELLEQVISDMSIKAEKYNLNIIYNLEDSILKIKANKIKEVFINLIDNAIKYSINTNDNNIKIRGFIEDNFYKVSIINEANPIPEEIYSHVFEPFIKINSDEDNYSSGLGLYLCNEIIKDHNGNITLSNGNKVEATVSLPF